MSIRMPPRAAQQSADGGSHPARGTAAPKATAGTPHSPRRGNSYRHRRRREPGNAGCPLPLPDAYQLCGQPEPRTNAAASRRSLPRSTPAATPAVNVHIGVTSAGEHEQWGAWRPACRVVQLLWQKDRSWPSKVSVGGLRHRNATELSPAAWDARTEPRRRTCPRRPGHSLSRRRRRRMNWPVAVLASTRECRLRMPA